MRGGKEENTEVRRKVKEGGREEEIMGIYNLCD